MLQAGRDSVSKASAPATAVVDDRLYVWEAVGLLLGPEEVGAEAQAAALATLLQPLSAQIQVCRVFYRTAFQCQLECSKM